MGRFIPAHLPALPLEPSTAAVASLGGGAAAPPPLPAGRPPMGVAIEPDAFQPRQYGALYRLLHQHSQLLIQARREAWKGWHHDCLAMLLGSGPATWDAGRPASCRLHAPVQNVRLTAGRRRSVLNAKRTIAPHISSCCSFCLPLHRSISCPWPPPTLPTLWSRSRQSSWRSSCSGLRSSSRWSARHRYGAGRLAESMCA